MWVADFWNTGNHVASQLADGQHTWGTEAVF